MEWYNLLSKVVPIGPGTIIQWAISTEGHWQPVLIAGGKMGHLVLIEQLTVINSWPGIQHILVG
jgi:hypothetical protein